MTMARILYIPEEGTPPTHKQFGIEWGKEPVEVSDPLIIAKCKGSPFYAVEDDGKDKPKAPAK